MEIEKLSYFFSDSEYCSMFSFSFFFVCFEFRIGVNVLKMQMCQQKYRLIKHS